MDASDWEAKVRAADFPTNGHLILDWSRELNQEADKLCWLIWPEKMQQLLQQRRDWTAAARKAAQRRRERLEALRASWVFVPKSPFPEGQSPEDLWGFAQSLFGEEMGVLEIAKEEFSFDTITQEKLALRAEASKLERLDFYGRYGKGMPRLIGLLALLYGAQEGVLGFEQELDRSKIWVYAT